MEFVKLCLDPSTFFEKICNLFAQSNNNRYRGLARWIIKCWVDVDPRFEWVADIVVSDQKTESSFDLILVTKDKQEVLLSIVLRAEDLRQRHQELLAILSLTIQPQEKKKPFDAIFILCDQIPTDVEEWISDRIRCLSKEDLRGTKYSVTARLCREMLVDIIMPDRWKNTMQISRGCLDEIWMEMVQNLQIQYPDVIQRSLQTTPEQSNKRKKRRTAK
jgi:hypothetical protein